METTATDARDLDTGSVLAILSEGPAEVLQHAYVVGAWVWVEFPTRPAREVTNYLSSVGFHWNSTRKVWQHSCGIRRHADRRGDPRWTYGMLRLGTARSEDVDETN